MSCVYYLEEPNYVWCYKCGMSGEEQDMDICESCNQDICDECINTWCDDCRGPVCHKCTASDNKCISCDKKCNKKCDDK